VRKVRYLTARYICAAHAQIDRQDKSKIPKTQSFFFFCLRLRLTLPYSHPKVTAKKKKADLLIGEKRKKEKKKRSAPKVWFSVYRSGMSFRCPGEMTNLRKELFFPGDAQ
jgi:hypothetical protein